MKEIQTGKCMHSVLFKKHIFLHVLYQKSTNKLRVKSSKMAFGAKSQSQVSQAHGLVILEQILSKVFSMCSLLLWRFDCVLLFLCTIVCTLHIVVAPSLLLYALSKTVKYNACFICQKLSEKNWIWVLYAFKIKMILSYSWWSIWTVPIWFFHQQFSWKARLECCHNRGLHKISLSILKLFVFGLLKLFTVTMINE